MYVCMQETCEFICFDALPDCQEYFDGLGECLERIVPQVDAKLLHRFAGSIVNVKPSL